MRTASGTTGLTLVEVLVSLTIASLVLAGTYGVLVYAARCREQVISAGPVSGGAAGVGRLLGADLRRIVQTPLGEQDNALIGYGAADAEGRLLRMVAAVGRRPVDAEGAMTGAVQVTWSLRPGQDDRLRLVRSEAPAGYAPGGPDAGRPVSPPLLDARMRHLGPDGWTDTWDAPAGKGPASLPWCVELTLHLSDGGPPVRHRCWLTHHLPPRPQGPRP